jgi:hypothetical protein
VSWVKLVVLAFQLAADFARWVEREKIRTEAERALLAEARKIIDANVETANAARDRVRDQLDAGGLREPDKYVRKE